MLASVAQAQEVTKSDYEGLIDELICQFTDLALREQAEQPHYQAFKTATFGGNCNHETIRQFLRGRNPIPKRTLEIINILDKEYRLGYDVNSSNQELYSMVMDVFDEQLIEDFAADHTESFPDFKSTLDDRAREVFQLNATIDTTFNNDTTPNLSNPTPPASEPKSNANNVGNLWGNQFLFIGLLLMLLALAAYFIYGYLTSRRAKEGEQQATSRSAGNPYQQELQTLKTQLDGHEQILERLQNQIKGLHEELYKLSEYAARNTNHFEYTPKATTQEVVDLDEDVIEEPPTTHEADTTPRSTTSTTADTEEEPETLVDVQVFFMPSPAKGGVFKTEYQSTSFIATESVYRFELLSPSEAKFTFYNDRATVSRALNNYDTYLKPVCKSLNDLNPNAAQIITQVPGTAYLHGDTWKVKERALVYYE